MRATRPRSSSTWCPAPPKPPSAPAVRSCCPFQSPPSPAAIPNSRSWRPDMTKNPKAPRHLVDLIDLDRGWVDECFQEAERLRARRGTPDAPRPLAGRTAALVFHKPSLRTRVSFTAGMHELGGDTV